MRLDRQRMLHGWSSGMVNVYGVELVTDRAEMERARDELVAARGSEYAILRVKDGYHGADQLRKLIKKGFIARPPTLAERVEDGPPGGHCAGRGRPPPGSLRPVRCGGPGAGGAVAGGSRPRRAPPRAKAAGKAASAGAGRTARRACGAPLTSVKIVLPDRTARTARTSSIRSDGTKRPERPSGPAPPAGWRVPEGAGARHSGEASANPCAAFDPERAEDRVEHLNEGAAVWQARRVAECRPGVTTQSAGR